MGNILVMDIKRLKTLSGLNESYSQVVNEDTNDVSFKLEQLVGACLEDGDSVTDIIAALVGITQEMQADVEAGAYDNLDENTMDGQGSDNTINSIQDLHDFIMGGSQVVYNIMPETVKIQGNKMKFSYRVGPYTDTDILTFNPQEDTVHSVHNNKDFGAISTQEFVSFLETGE
jgi:hypothetical protein